MIQLVNERAFYWAVFGCFVAFAAIAFVVLHFVSAPYGRHFRGGWDPSINATLGWIVMESPALLTFVAFWLAAAPDRRYSIVGLVLLSLWVAHYFYRALLYPLRRRGGAGEMPVAVVAMAILFNIANGYLNAHWIYALGPKLEVAWLADPRFILGAGLFALGYWINHRADAILRALRDSKGAEHRVYSLPRGGLFDRISCPNYFGELVEWTGWALCTFSPAGLAFAIASAANLIPRARTHHKWYQQTFPEYPSERKAIIPFVL